MNLANALNGQTQGFEISNLKRLNSVDNYPLIIKEDTTNFCRFNIMPEKFVEETLFIQEYHIYSDRIEAIFDRHYCSDMLKSPSHLVVFTMLAHTQKLLYVYLCYLLDKSYNTNESEKLKIWATKIDIDLPKLVTDTHNIIQTLKILNLEKNKPKQYITQFITNVSERIIINSTCNIYDIE